MNKATQSTPGKRNRAAGNNWERELAKFFRELGYPHVATTRQESRSRDADKIDLMNKEEHTNGRFPFNIQAKNTIKQVKYAKLLSELPTQEGVINAIFHKHTTRTGDRFLGTGKYVILSVKDFEKLLRIFKANNLVLTPQMVAVA